MPKFVGANFDGNLFGTAQRARKKDSLIRAVDASHTERRPE
jgi:hypothetical protein